MATTTKKKSKSDEIRRRVAYLEGPVNDEERAHAEDIARCLARLESRKVSSREAIAFSRVFTASSRFYKRVLSKESIDVMERELQVILDENGLSDPTRVNFTQASTSALVARDALHAIHMIRVDQEDVGRYYYDLAMQIQFLAARLDWPDAQSARRGRSSGGKTRAAYFAAQYTEWQHEVDRLVLKSGNSYSSACENASKHFSVASRTIQRHTSDPRKNL